jgi:hypothetical protein
VNLSIYDPIKGCFVLNPKEFNPVINAFHPDYVKTYMPELLSSIKLEGTQKANGVINGGKSKATREAVNKGAFTISQFPKTKAKSRVNLEPTDFRVFSKAGAPKGAKK